MQHTMLEAAEAPAAALLVSDADNGDTFQAREADHVQGF